SNALSTTRSTLVQGESTSPKTMPNLANSRHLKHANGARDQQNDNSERDQNLDHRKDFCPAREQRRVSRAEGRTLREGNEDVIDKKRPPVRTRKLRALVMRDLHLRKKEARAAEFLLLPAQGRSAAVQSPIPKRKDDHVC